MRGTGAGVGDGVTDTADAIFASMAASSSSLLESESEEEGSE